MPVRAAGLQAD